MDRLSTHSKAHAPTPARYVKEGDTCSNWEQCERPCIKPFRECWFCKWSDFDLDAVQHETVSICHYPNE